MQKIHISGHGFEYIRGYIDGAEKIDATELMGADESISVSRTNLTSLKN